VIVRRRRDGVGGGQDGERWRGKLGEMEREAWRDVEMERRDWERRWWEDGESRWREKMGRAMKRGDVKKMVGRWIWRER
jgi:hypothetical protein